MECAEILELLGVTDFGERHSRILMCRQMEDEVTRMKGAVNKLGARMLFKNIMIKFIQEISKLNDSNATWNGSLFTVCHVR